MRASTRGLSAPLLLTPGAALLLGVGGTLAVNRLVSRPTVATAHVSAQYLPPVSRQPQVATAITTHSLR